MCSNNSRDEVGPLFKAEQMHLCGFERMAIHLNDFSVWVLSLEC